MCHLSIEKSLKGLYSKKLHEVKPKPSLSGLLNKIGEKPSQELEKFIIKLNTASVATRYPDEISAHTSCLHSRDHERNDPKK